MAKQQIVWRKGRRPEELAAVAVRNAPRRLKTAFLHTVKDTAGDPPSTWPVRTGLSRDTYHWQGDLFVSTDYAPYADEFYGGVIENMWDRFGNEELDRYWKEIVRDTVTGRFKTIEYGDVR